MLAVASGAIVILARPIDAWCVGAILLNVPTLFRIPTVTTALWGCLVARNAYAYS